MFRDLASLLVLFFPTTLLGIAPAIAGSVIFIPKLILRIGCDIAIGAVSDRRKRRFERRRWLFAGAAESPVAILLLFHVPVASEVIRVAYLATVFSQYMMVFANFFVH